MQGGALPQAVSAAGQPEGPTCRGDTRIQIKLGGIIKEITPVNDMQNGQLTSNPCSNVNSLYAFGSIQMECQNGYIHVDLSQCKIRQGPTSDQCKDEEEELKKEFAAAVQAISAEKSQLEDEVASTACEDTAQQQHQQNTVPLQQQQDQLTLTLNTQTGHLASYRGRIDEAATAEANLRSDIQSIALRCKEAERVIAVVDKVRESIHILDLCPGLGQLEFTLPDWVGTWVVLDVKSELRDAEIDSEMYTMCRGLASGGGTPRPAESGEIQQGAIAGAPETNTASLPLMGTCPGCEGMLDSESGVTHPSGHARICWDTGATLDGESKRKDCSHGRKAIMCVLDNNQQTSPPTAPVQQVG
jgi:hypothetical protein